MKISAKTHIGMVREKNEDSYFVDADEKKIFIVADGMGGHLSGEIASNMAVETAAFLMREKFVKGEKINSENMVKWIRETLDEANEKVYRKSFENEKYFGMGTTIVLTVIQDEKVYIAHVGDSRAYLLNKNQLTLMTKDHTLVQALVDNGTISLDEAKTHPKRNVIMRALGTNRNIDVDIQIIQKPEFGSVLLMCTDGLTGAVTDDEIVEIINSSDMDNACNMLIELANERGGTDNITVVAIQFLEETNGGND